MTITQLISELKQFSGELEVKYNDDTQGEMSIESVCLVALKQNIVTRKMSPVVPPFILLS